MINTIPSIGPQIYDNRLSLSLLFKGELDPDAAAYIAAVEGAGAIVSSGQKSAINTFFRAEKSESRWDLHKRIYLPIWGVAAANAICLRSLTSGSFVGGVTHGSGFVQGDGSTGYFDTGISPLSAGINTSSGSMFVLHKNLPSAYSHGCTSGTSSFSMVSGPSLGIRINIIGGNLTISNTPTGNGSNAVTIASRTSTTTLSGMKRISSGVSPTYINNIDVSAFVVPDYNIYALARNNNGTPFINTPDIQLGAFGFGLALTGREMEYLTLRIKNLWETCTGLTLP